MKWLSLQVALDIAVWGLQHVAHQCFAGQTAVRAAGGISALVKVPIWFPQGPTGIAVAAAHSSGWKKPDFATCEALSVEHKCQCLHTDVHEGARLLFWSDTAVAL